MRATPVFLAILLVSCAAYSQPCLPATTTQYEPQRVIFQKFPANGPGETAWGIVWSENHDRGLRIEAAFLWRKPPFTWGNALQVLGPTGLSDIFVPYHIDSTRLTDLHGGVLSTAIPDDAGACGTIPAPAVVSPNDSTFSRRVLVKEIRDRGVAWTSDRHTRRGQELVLWATYDSGNYEYITEYTFRDDGVITGRLGSTGYNNPNLPLVAHMHDALWRVNVDLGGAAHNTVMVMEHAESDTNSFGTATDPMFPFNGGFEGGVDRDDLKFTHLNISNQLLTNAQGHPISYDLMPLQAGTARHFEDFTHHDFWVTHENPIEDTYISGFEGAGAPYITPAEPITNTDITIWYMSSIHHRPRDEDFEYGQPNRLPGVALVMWSGFELYPRNLFDDTPIHTPICSAVPANLSAWWPFDELSGATIVNLDSAGQPTQTSLTGTPHPGAVGSLTGPAPVSGVVHGALQFNGTNQYVEVANDPALNFDGGNFSIDAWLKTTQSNGTILDKRTAAPLTGYGLFLQGGKPGLQLAVAGQFANYITDVVVADGNWHHLVVIVTRTANIHWFIDATPAASNTGPLLLGSITNSSPLRVATRSAGLGGVFWAGTIDEIELFNRALTASEAVDLDAAGHTGKCR